MKIKFEYPEDEKYFKDLLCSEGDNLEKYESLFDFSPPKDKRFKFNVIRSKVLDKLINKYGKICMINYPNKCDLRNGFEVDHLIPLSSNKLNKEIRRLLVVKGKKVSTQSFGSNHENNLILSCNTCNSHKKHRFLEKEHLQRILKIKFKPTAQ